MSYLDITAERRAALAAEVKCQGRPTVGDHDRLSDLVVQAWADLDTRRNAAETAAVKLAREVQESRKTLAAIDALHMPSIGNVRTCVYCISTWPCTTRRLIHPEEEA